MISNFDYKENFDQFNFNYFYPLMHSLIQTLANVYTKGYVTKLDCGCI